VEKYSLEKVGLTQGMMVQWMQCRQKAKWFMENYSLKSTSMGLTYGTIGHAVLEKAYEDIRTKKFKGVPSSKQVKGYIEYVEKEWKAENTRVDARSMEFLELSLIIAEATIPLYFEYWKKDASEIQWVSLEKEFKIPFKVEVDGTNYVVPIRGKIDGVFKSPKMWVFESKFKSRIDEEDMVDTLPFELQVNTYLWAVKQLYKETPSGVLYNIVRRIGLQRKKAETIAQFAKRCIDDVKARPEFYFLRLEVSISKKEMEKFELEMTDMVSDFIRWWKGKTGHYKNTSQCIDKYGRCNYLPLCSGQRFNLYTKREKFYRELEDY
jgi:hypothetical protein